MNFILWRLLRWWHKLIYISKMNLSTKSWLSWKTPRVKRHQQYSMWQVIRALTKVMALDIVRKEETERCSACRNKSVKTEESRITPRFLALKTDGRKDHLWEREHFLLGKEWKELLYFIDSKMSLTIRVIDIKIK